MKNISILYKTENDGQVPVKLGDPTDAGYDMFAASEPEIVGEKVVEVNGLKYQDTYYDIDYIQYKTGLFVEPLFKDEPIRLDLRPRSSISKYWLSLCNTPATIDHTYGNEILVRFKPFIQPSMMNMLPNGKFALTLNRRKIYQKGDRICQILPEYVKGIKWVEATKIQSNRGGFGSTGK